MTDSTVGNDGTQDTDEGQNPGGEADEQQGKESDKDDAAQREGDEEAPDEDQSPEWMRKELTRVRKEAAAKRTALKEAQEKLANAKTPEEFEAVKTEFQTKIDALEYEVAKSKVLRENNIPAEYEDLLDGVPADKLEEKAKKLATLANAQKTSEEDDLDDLLGGLDPRNASSGVDSVEALYAAVPR